MLLKNATVQGLFNEGTLQDCHYDNAFSKFDTFGSFLFLLVAKKSRFSNVLDGGNLSKLLETS